MKTVFVYGTLKSGNTMRGLDSICEQSKFLGTAKTIEGTFRMFDMGAFPAVVPGGNADVHGELWAVTPETMEVLDHIEGYPDFYNRRLVLTDGGEAWMYYIRQVSPGMHHIPAVKGVVEWHG